MQFDEDLKEMLVQAVHFSFWAAGQGITPIAGEDAESPEDFLLRYSLATDDEDWENLSDRLRGLLNETLKRTQDVEEPRHDP